MEGRTFSQTVIQSTPAVTELSSSAEPNIKPRVRVTIAVSSPTVRAIPRWRSRMPCRRPRRVRTRCRRRVPVGDSSNWLTTRATNIRTQHRPRREAGRWKPIEYHRRRASSSRARARRCEDRRSFQQQEFTPNLSSSDPGRWPTTNASTPSKTPVRRGSRSRYGSSGLPRTSDRFVGPSLTSTSRPLVAETAPSRQSPSFL